MPRVSTRRLTCVMRKLALALLWAMASASCTPMGSAPASECHPTVAYMTAPAEVIDFFASGSSQPDLAREAWKSGTVNAYGNDAMWVALPPNGELVGRLDDKIPPYRLKPGRVEWEARRLDGPGSVPRQPVGPDGYGDRGFQAGGVSFPEAGCWEVTYRLDGHDELRFALTVRCSPSYSGRGPLRAS